MRLANEENIRLTPKASSSIGRALVSKTSGCGFKSCLACLKKTTPL